MKHIYHLTRIPRILSFLLFLTLSFTVSNYAYGQDQEVVLFVSCVEDLGNGDYVAYFGYDNPNPETVTVQRKRSYIAYNYDRDTKYVLNTFEPGVHEKVFSYEFSGDDWVRWTVKFSNRYTDIVRADSNSEFCVNELPIIPGYNPPEGGKQFDSKIGAELTSLYNVYAFDPANFAGATDAIFQLEGSRVLIEVVSYDGQFSEMIYSLDSLGFEKETSVPGRNHATGWVEIGDLLKLNEFADLYYARPVYPGISNYVVPPTGVTKSQGDFAIHSDFARLGFEIDGSGVKIGVLSNSYNTKNTAHIDVQNGDLPGSTNPNLYTSEVEVLKDIIPTSGPLSDEGRAMLQIIHDVAPGAELGFRTGFLGELDMAQGIRELADAGYDVIVDDLSYVTEPFFRDGVISQTIDSVVSEGVTFFSSAGNFGRSSYAGEFTPVAAPVSIGGEAHNFAYLSGGPADVFQAVELPPGSYMMVMQWDDGSDPSMNTTQTDLDIFLSDDIGSARLGFNRENIGGFPIEVVPFSVAGDTVISNIVVARAAGSAVNVQFKYIIFRGGSQFKMLEYGDQGNSTIVGHPNADGAISVGAVRFDKNQIYSPGVYTEPVIMSFSSVGGTPVNGVVRAKPDITAPNGVNTTIDLGNGDWDSSIDPDTLFPNFFGTSAASPHAAGVAALYIEAKAKFDLDSTVGPADIRSVLKATALDMETPGEDLISGAGFIQAHKAIMTFAYPSPYVGSLIAATDSLSSLGDSIVPFTFTLSGDFFTDSTQVLFRGEPLDSGVVITDENTIIVSHPGFLGQPVVQAYTPSISESGIDGGYSEEWYFSDTVKYKVIITANNSDKKYGEVLPDFSSFIQLINEDQDTLSLEQAVQNGIVLQQEADRLSGLSYSLPATDTSDAGIYFIAPSISPALGSDSLYTEVDFAISEKYKLEYVNGNLIVEKLALKITPQDVTITYGDSIPQGGLSFDYEFGDSLLSIPNPGLILNSVQQEHGDALTNEIALVRGIAMVNGIPMIRGIAMVNGVTMLRGIALVNGVEVRVEVEGADTTVYVAGEPVVNAGTLIRGIAMVNDLPFVNMTEIVRGVALVNGDQITLEDGYITELNGDASLVNGSVPAIRGIAMVNGPGVRGIALVNGVEVLVSESGVTTIDGDPVPAEGVALVNGIPTIRGIALVNSSLISRGIALVNGLEVPIENGIPTIRGIAMVNGIPMLRGVALVNNLEVRVEDGEVSEVFENGVLVNGLNLSRGIAMVNGVALVNGFGSSRGIALVNGIAMVNEFGDGEDFVDLENKNFLASTNAIANGLPNVRGIALVNGLEAVESQALKVASGTLQPDSSIIYEEVIPNARGIALVNGLAYVRGIALVNGVTMQRGIALVNGSTIDENSNGGSILVFDATDIGAPPEQVSMKPISFITGTTAGQHWIVPGTYLSNNFEISYGLGTLTIDEADLSITAADDGKTFGEADPEVLDYSYTGLLAGDSLTGELLRDEGEDAGVYGIRQGSLTAGDNYAIQYDSGVFTIDPAALLVTADAESKVYDGLREAQVSLTDDRLPGSELSFSYTSALFADKNVGIGKEVTVLGIAVSGADAGNYLANETATDTASISQADLQIGITASSKTYDGTTDAATAAFIVDGKIAGDLLSVSSSEGSFDTKNVGTGKLVTATVSATGDDAMNYSYNTQATDTASIHHLDLEIGISASNKVYDGDATAITSAYVISGALYGDVSVASANGLFDSKDVGSDKTVTADVFALGPDALNYSANLTAVTSADITSRELTVTAVDTFLYINEGDPLPVFAFHYLGWIPGDVGNESYTVLRDSDGATYDQASSESAGTYTVTPTPSNSNYTFAIETGMLHVNPYGPSTRAVKPVLNCIEELYEGYYVANFEYRNENDVAVYIPVGEDNFLTGSGIDWENSDPLPTWFEAGGGSFTVFFDGADLSWVVDSRDGDQKVRNAANANSSSTKCKGNGNGKGNGKKSASVETGLGEEDLLDPEQLVAYPNPVTDKLYVSLKGIEHYKMIVLYDFAGRSHVISSIDKRSDRLEIDMAHLSSGNYFLRIVLEEKNHVVPIIKQ